jgi:NAD(P)H-dependent flavin oxidoreductase YrpB (nitropropane dioxygenase family)
MGPFPVTNLCIAAANAGCLGLLSTFGPTSRDTNPAVFKDFCDAAHAETTDDDVTIFKKMFRRVFEETGQSQGVFGANVMVSAEVLENAKKVMKALKEVRDENPEMKKRFRVLVTSAGDPVPWANFVKENDLIWMHVFPSVKAAARCKKAGVQVLIASGHEGGLHTAWQPVHSMTLLPDIVEKFTDENTLVCGTGGFCDGKSIAAAFAMGADGVHGHALSGDRGERLFPAVERYGYRGGRRRHHHRQRLCRAGPLAENPRLPAACVQYRQRGTRILRRRSR